MAVLANTLAHGFVNSKHLLDRRVTEVGTDEVFKMVQDSAAWHTAKSNAYLSQICEFVTWSKRRVKLSGLSRLQPIGPDGEPRPVAHGGYQEVELPIFGGATAWGGDRVSLAQMSMADANEATLEAQKGDARSVTNHIRAALLTSTAYTEVSQQDIGGTRVVNPLANNDTHTYLKKDGSTATAQHYLATASAIGNANNIFITLHDLLMTYPSNFGRDVVCYIPTGHKTTTEALTGFVPIADKYIKPGASTATLTGANLDAIKGLGTEVLGRVSDCWIVLDQNLPADYILAMAVGTKPIALRQYPESSLQGLQATMTKPNAALTRYDYVRFLGAGVQNRIAAAVYYMGGGAYVDPATLPAAAGLC